LHLVTTFRHKGLSITDVSTLINYDVKFPNMQLLNVQHNNHIELGNLLRGKSKEKNARKYEPLG
jgi:hypothetical protein